MFFQTLFTFHHVAKTVRRVADYSAILHFLNNSVLLRFVYYSFIDDEPVFELFNDSFSSFLCTLHATFFTATVIELFTFGINNRHVFLLC